MANRGSPDGFREAGFSLLEIGIVLLVLSVAFATVYRNYLANEERATRRSFVDNAGELFLTAREMKVGGNYVGINEPRLRRLAPKAWQASGGQMIHDHGGRVNAWASSAFGVPSGAYALDFRGVPPATCIAMANSLAAGTLFFGVRVDADNSAAYAVRDVRNGTEATGTRIRTGCTGRGADSLSVYIYGR